MFPRTWTQVAPSGSLEDLLMRIQAGNRAQVQPLGGGRWVRLGRFLQRLGHPVARVPSLAEALPYLLPKVRTLDNYDAYARNTGKAVPVHRPLCGNLAVSLVADLPNQDLDLDAAQIQAWNADFDVLLQRARTNLLARGERKFREVLPGCYRSAWQDGLDGSRILLPGILQGLKLTGDPVAVLPGRDTLLVTGSGDDQGLVWLLESLLAHLALDGEATDATPLRYRNLGWEPLQLPEDHPAAALLTRLQARRGPDRRKPDVRAA